jgi:hypothetical protein
MMLGTVWFGSRGVAIWWYGWTGWLESYMWGKSGGTWPTIYLGPVKLITGPAFDDVYAWGVEINRSDEAPP